MNLNMFGIEFTDKMFDTDLTAFADKYELRDQPSKWNDRYGRFMRKRFSGCVVYLMFMDACLDGEELIPLYVGQTCNLVTRIGQHRDKAWFNHVEYMFVEKFDTQSEAEKLERELIEKLRPVFNKQVRGRKYTKAPLHTPKTAAMTHLRDLINYKTFNGDDHYEWVTKDLPTIQAFPLR